MELKFYPSLNRRSKRALLRKRKRFGHPYHYNPRKRLLERLSHQSGLSIEEVKEQLRKERAFILKYPNYYP